MCGISGIVNLSGSEMHLPSILLGMHNAMQHRGPDGEGFVFADAAGNCAALFSDNTAEQNKNQRLPWSPNRHLRDYQENAVVGLGQRRLSIVDLSVGGHQPQCTADGRYWITYNGEIYNYIELRKELEQHGYKFLTGSDTEVILNAYQYWGETCMHQFNGMWAFVIYDRQQQRLFGSRDRFGVKPFYYYLDNFHFSFASEQRALRTNPFIQTGLNHDAVADYFIAGEIELEPESFFKNIIELFPSHAFELDVRSGAFRTWKYYELPVNNAFEVFDENTFNQYSEKIHELLGNAVRLRLRSDVPVGSCLSGGIDSSAIAGLIKAQVGNDAKANIGDRLKLFTAAFDDAAIDERRWAKEVVNNTGAEWFTVTPTAADLQRDLEELVYAQDVPIWSTSTYAQHRVMKLVRDSGIRVVLDGQGGDELFAGYHPYYIFQWNDLRRNGRYSDALREVRQFGGLAKGMKYWARENFKQRTFYNFGPERQVQILKRYFNDIEMLHPDLISNFIKRRALKTEKAADTLNDALYREFVHTRLKGYLKCEDRCSMFHSVESRTPFADDHKLIEFVFSIPGNYKIHNGVTKALLRKAAAPYLPPAIAQRKDKMGYATPNNAWITQLKSDWKFLISSQEFKGILNKEKLLADYDTFFDVAGKPENGRTFKFIAFAAWMKVNKL